VAEHGGPAEPVGPVTVAALLGRFVDRVLELAPEEDREARVAMAFRMLDELEEAGGSDLIVEGEIVEAFRAGIRAAREQLGRESA
jgi:hypothetical protein